MRLVLASASPRRLDLLRLAGFDPLVRPVEVDETPHAAEDPVDYVVRLAAVKASTGPAGADEVVLAADTTVILDGAILGKPADEAEAAAMLHRLAGRSHEVATGVAVRRGDVRADALAVVTTVTFTSLDAATIARYIATGEPFDKAGGYGIQGAAAGFVARISGSYTNVVGLPLAESIALLRGAGVEPA